MEIYIESNTNLLVRLSREAHTIDISIERYVIIAKGLSNVLHTIAKHHGLYYLQYIAYLTSLKLGHVLGPINENIMERLPKRGSSGTKLIYTHLHTHIHTHTYIHTYIYVYMYIWIYVCMYVCIYTYI